MVSHSQVELQLLNSTSQGRLPKGRSIALFPGSFKPPHRAHYEGVMRLLQREDIDEVVIIISARARRLPESRLGLDAGSAANLWRAMLEDDPRVSIEIAEHSAIRHALGFFDRATPADRLLFCIGESDWFSGDARFDRIQELSEQASIPAAIVTLPTGFINIRATELRGMLGGGDSERSAFMKAMPQSFSDEKKEEVWKRANENVRDILEITATKLTRLLEPLDLDDIVGIKPVDDRGVEFRCRDRTGLALRVKYAGDEIVRSRDPRVRGTRARLSAARRALKALASHDLKGLVVPKVRLFEKHSRTLVLEHVLPDGSSLGRDLKHRRELDSEVARDLGRKCALLHSLPAPRNPIRGSTAADEEWWLQRLKGFAAGAASDGALAASRKAARPGIFHLDLGCEKIRRQGDRLGVVDWEMSSAFADPAYDVASIVRSCRKLAQNDIAKPFLSEFLEAYLEHSNEGASFVGRVWELAGKPDGSRE